MIYVINIPQIESRVNTYFNIFKYFIVILNYLELVEDPK